jgi:hypothetical protein
MKRHVLKGGYNLATQDPNEDHIYKYGDYVWKNIKNRKNDYLLWWAAKDNYFVANFFWN